MKQSKVIGATGTILLHLLIVFAFLYNPPKYLDIQPVPEMKEPHRIEVKLIPIIKPTLDSIIKTKDNGKKVSYPTDSKICNGKDKFYKGIGVIYNPGTHIITHAPEYYPGYIAGLRVGDFIVDPESQEINGYITFDIMRSREQQQFHIKTDNICFQDT